MFRIVEGEAGDSGRLKGEVRGEPNESGEGLNGAEFEACEL